MIEINIENNGTVFEPKWNVWKLTYDDIFLNQISCIAVGSFTNYEDALELKTEIENE